jgi:DNA-binding MarR family transcriptional regulator
MLRDSGLRATQFSLLMLIAARGRVSLTDLAGMAVMDRTTLTRNLRPLERRGLVQIRPGEDRRVREISLTPRGKDALAAAFPLWQLAQAEVASSLGPARLSRLLGDLGAAVEAGGGA